jgi:hypothetical protein
MLCDALEQADGLCGIVMVRIVVRLIGLKRKIRGRGVLMTRRDVSRMSLRLQMLLTGIVPVVVVASEIFMAVMACAGRVIGEITLLVRLSGWRQRA